MKGAAMERNKTRDMVYIAVFAVIITICSWISIPSTVPFTLQTLGVFLAVGILGGKRGCIAVFVYLLLGIFGIPVFAGFTGGIGVILSIRGGYMIGFLLAALVMWAAEAVLGKKTWALALAMVLGLLTCYLFGTVWFMVVYAKSIGEIGVWTALGWCVIPFIIPDMVKIAAALFLCRRLKPVINIV